MTTLRESYIEGVMAAFVAAAGFPATVERSLVTAFSREESPVIVVHRGAENLENTLDGPKYRKCEILFSVISRGATPDKDADDVMDVAHPLIMRYAGTNLLNIEELGTAAPKFANADSQACMVTARYAFLYETVSDSLSA